MQTLFMKSSAVLSDCGTYRYTLTRRWDPGRPVLAWCMLNPSVADADQDDNTIRRLIRFAGDWRFGGILVVNLFALRATDPRELYKHEDPVGPDNDGHILEAATYSKVLVAWGNHGGLRGRDRQVLELLRHGGRTVECLGVTDSGQPKHPLYLAGETKPVTYRERS